MKKRYFGMDVVRILALCLLYWLHFFLRNGFYSKPVDNPVMIVAVSGRIIFMCCVPLFLMITGYLKCGKEWSRDYYFSLLPILISWVMISFICIGYKILVAGTEKTLYGWAVEFFNFSGANYGWYIEMYIGLLLMSPFINLAWKAAESRKMHRLMVAVMVFLTILPKTVNVLMLDGGNTLNLIPNYWVNLYFITYYIIGCYIRTYQPKVSRAACFTGIVCVALTFAFINYMTGHGAKIGEGYTISYNHAGTAVIAVLLFLSVYQIDCNNKMICRLATLISGVTLEMYLISCVFDQKIFSWQKGYPAGEYWWRGLAATGLVFLLSFLSGWCIHQISVRMSSLIQNRMNK
ncbi:MAG: acyltransferase family protein [Lachnospiraceae bacterium]|nr:acyltransferase family protein [Lachnospiraceae bacterium]